MPVDIGVARPIVEQVLRQWLWAAPSAIDQSRIDQRFHHNLDAHILVAGADRLAREARDHRVPRTEQRQLHRELVEVVFAAVGQHRELGQPAVLFRRQRDFARPHPDVARIEVNPVVEGVSPASRA